MTRSPRRPTIGPIALFPILLLIARPAPAAQGARAAAARKPAPASAPAVEGAGATAATASKAGKASPEALDATAVTARLQRRYDLTDTFSADFAQEMKLATGGPVPESSGKVWFHRPGRMLWRYEKPEEQSILADGDHLWIHQPSDKQVLRAPLS
ncbi:MAG: LolA family protein [Alphaproteobacteria bacterium]